MPIKIYLFKNAASCCPGGACGPWFGDPTSQLVSVVNEVVQEYNGKVEAELVDLLNYRSMAKHGDVIKVLSQYGLLSLPILKIEDSIVCHGFVPEKEDVISFIELKLRRKHERKKQITTVANR